MLLRSITLQDFGLYAGQQSISLLPRTRYKKERPIILIGGNNGAGKTSLLDAVRLTLYGKLALGNRVSQSDYNAYLKSRIHVPPASKQKPSSASITLDFDYAEAGITHRYQVVRAWAVRGQSLIESLDISKDGSELASVPREEWQFFLQDMLPPGVSQLFFFDGEKITDIAEDKDSDEHLSHAIRALLGIEIVSRLRTDLGLFISRQERANVDDSADRLDEVMRDHGRLDEELSQLREQAAELRTRFDGQERTAEKARQRFIASGGDVAMRVGELRGERDLLQKRQSALLARIREGSAGLWPLAVAPKLLSRVLDATARGGTHSGPALSSTMRAALKHWLANTSDAGRRRWKGQVQQDFDEILKQATNKTATASTGTAQNPIAHVSNGRERLERALSQSRQEAAASGAEYAQIIERLRSIEAALARVDETTTDFRLDELRTAEQACGATRQEIESAETRIKELVYRQTVLERERTRILSEQSDRSQSDRRMELASKTSKVLAAYESALVKQKTRALEKAFVECFNRLARKGDVVRGVRIDDTTFQATLIDADGGQIPKRLLSAGEKQIYAIAMLWALAKTSGRKLPVIIDTPLARLDSEHRANIIGRYLPEVSHQVIVLSTDTEVDVEVVTTLEKHVSHSYLLDYIRREGRTEAQPGYFEALRQEMRGIHALQ
ncbi:DNA sulfur modification protein DndD [Lysobacter enzymogenes]|uniref:DNA sulfur modification protein DndD n=1 Tax=Lysobacter enzymogenes TaxID=69 RepID=UPI0037480F2B